MLPARLLLEDLKVKEGPDLDLAVIVARLLSAVLVAHEQIVFHEHHFLNALVLLNDRIKDLSLGLQFHQDVLVHLGLAPLKCVHSFVLGKQCCLAFLTESFQPRLKSDGLAQKDCSLGGYWGNAV